MGPGSTVARRCAQRAVLAEHGERLRGPRAGRRAGPLPAELDDEQLEALRYRERAATRPYPEPDYPYIHRELRRKGVTLQLLWQEYRAVHGEEGLQYSAFCDRYRRWRGQLEPVMRQTHAPGDKLFVDYAGATVPIVDAETGEVTEASVFVAGPRGEQLHLRRGRCR